MRRKLKVQGVRVLGFPLCGGIQWLIIRNHNENYGEVKGNRLKNRIHRKVAPVPSAGFVPALLRGATG